MSTTQTCQGTGVALFDSVRSHVEFTDELQHRNAYAENIHGPLLDIVKFSLQFYFMWYNVKKLTCQTIDCFPTGNAAVRTTHVRGNAIGLHIYSL